VPRQKTGVHEAFRARRPSGAILVIDSYEIAAISDGKTRFEAQYKWV